MLWTLNIGLKYYDRLSQYKRNYNPIEDPRPQPQYFFLKKNLHDSLPHHTSINTFDLVELCKMSSIYGFISENTIYREVSFGSKRFLHALKKEKQLQTQLFIEAENKGYFNHYHVENAAKNSFE